MKARFDCICGFTVICSGKDPMPRLIEWKTSHLALSADGSEHAATYPRSAAAQRRKAWKKEATNV